MSPDMYFSFTFIYWATGGAPGPQKFLHQQFQKSFILAENVCHNQVYIHPVKLKLSGNTTYSSSSTDRYLHRGDHVFVSICLLSTTLVVYLTLQQCTNCYSGPSTAIGVVCVFVCIFRQKLFNKNTSDLDMSHAVPLNIICYVPRSKSYVILLGHWRK